jgi:hypothetical protein
MIVEMDVGPAGREWMLESLQHGLTLSRFLLEREDLLQGSLVTLLPDDVTDDIRLNVRGDPFIDYRDASGELRPVGAYEHLAALVVHHLLAAPDNCVLAEDTIASSADPWITTYPPPTPLFFHGNEVYYYLDNRHASIELAEEALGGPSAAWSYIGVFTKKPLGLSTTGSSRELTTSHIRGAAEVASLIFVGTYDLASFLIWRTPADARVG